MKTDTRLPYTELDDGFLPPRDPVLGFIKCGGKDATVRFARTGRPWVAPTRLLDPARFEVTTREKRTTKVKGKQGTDAAGQDFTLDLGYVRDEGFHGLDGVGPGPSSLRVRLLYPRWNQNLITFLGAYGREWVCRGNGVEATDIKRGSCACPCPRLVQFSGKYDGTKPSDKLICKPHAQLNVILEDAGVLGGFWAFKTTSFETTSNLIKSLRIFEEMFGRIDGIPLELRVMAATKQIPGGGTTTQPIVTLVLPYSMETARQVAADAAAEARKFLPAGRPLDEETYREAVVSEMEEEASSYAGEFLPAEEVVEGGDMLLGESDVPLPDEDPDEEQESGGGPSVQEADDGPTAEAGAGPEDQDETPSPDDAPDDSDRNDDPEQLARDVLKAAGWNPDAIDDRVAYHVKTDTLDKLLERLERGHPEAWAKVTAPEVFDGVDEPADGLPS